ncbi:MAG TPA: preprotein translocase subunit SecG [Melioribacteraceae bacterium]|nr:preprotein translocase subunit SecG [Melioribacteraceae bacterium]
MFTFLMAISVIVAVLLVIIVLLQSSKGGGLSGTLVGGANVGAMFGTRKTADFLGKATWYLGGALLILAIVINLFFLPSASKTQKESIIQQTTQPSVPTTPNLPQQKK